MPQVTIHLNGEIRKVEVETDLPLYFALYKTGIDMPHGCLAGACGSCRVSVLRGFENLSPIDPVEANTLSSLYDMFKKRLGETESSKLKLRLACRAIPLGDVEIVPYK